MAYRAKWQVVMLVGLVVLTGVPAMLRPRVRFGAERGEIAAEGPRASSHGWLLDLRDDVSTAEVTRLAERFHVSLQPVSVTRNAAQLYHVDPVASGDAGAFRHALEQEALVEAVSEDWTYAIPEQDPTFLQSMHATQQRENAKKAPPATPNDPLFERQWHMRQIRMPEAWSLQQGAGVVVAVIDTGITPVEDLAGTELVPGWNFVDDTADTRDDHGHGTHVAGTIAQTTHNALGVTGVAYRAKLMPIKVLSASGSGGIGGIVAGIRFAVDHGAQVINMSLGGPYYSKPLANAVEYAYKRGVTVVCAAGNDGKKRVSYPAAHAGALAVSATQFDETVTFYSNWGKQIAVAAPGGNTRVDQNQDGIPDGVLQNTVRPDDPSQQDYLLFMGTSMASPHVAGVAALVHGAGVHDPDQVRDVMTSTARRPAHYVGSRDERYGAGIVDAAAAVDAAYGGGNGTRLGWVSGLLLAFVLIRRRSVGWLSLGTALAWSGGVALLFSLVPVPFLHKMVALITVDAGHAMGIASLLLHSALPVVALGLLFYRGARSRSVWLGISLAQAAILLSSLQAVSFSSWSVAVASGAWSIANAVVCVGFAWLLARTMRDSSWV